MPYVWKRSQGEARAFLILFYVMRAMWLLILDQTKHIASRQNQNISLKVGLLIFCLTGPVNANYI